MSLILHRTGNQRFVLQNAQTGELVGLLFAPSPNESRRAFEYDFGSTSDRAEITNIADFPEFDYLTFFTVESVGAFEFERAFQSEAWAAVRPLFGAAAKAIGYHQLASHPVATPITLQWQHTPPNPKGSWKIPATALWVTETAVWMGNRDGLIHVLNHQGEQINQFQLPKLCRGLGDRHQEVLAICDDGQVYEFSDKLPQPLYNARSSNSEGYYDYRMQALTVQAETMLLLDGYGNLTKFNLESLNLEWQVQLGTWQGWVVQADAEAVYVGHYHGVTCLELASGQPLWTYPTPAPVLCGVLCSDHLVVGTSDGKLYAVPKSSDRPLASSQIQPWVVCDGAVFACAAAPEADWLVVADGCGQLYGVNRRGDRLWQQTIPTGSVLNVQVWGTRIYATTTDGSLLCI